VLSQEHRAVYEAVFPELKGKCAYLVTMEIEDSGDLVDFIIALVDEDGKLAAAPIMTECLISYMPVAPTQLVEYRFSKEDSWRLGKVSLSCVEAYRKSKFERWYKMITTTGCTATLRSLLGVGLVSTLYDKYLLPSPEEEKKKYIVKCRFLITFFMDLRP